MMDYIRGDYSFDLPHDLVEVVRCKDCELWSSCLSKQEKQVLIDTNTDGVCEYWMSDGLMPNDFCSYGRRKEGEDGQLQDQD